MERLEQAVDPRKIVIPTGDSEISLPGFVAV